MDPIIYINEHLNQFTPIGIKEYASPKIRSIPTPSFPQPSQNGQTNPQISIISNTQEKLEQDLMALINQIELADNSISMEELILQYPYWLFKAESSGIEILDMILPPEIRDIPNLEQTFDAIIKINGLAKISISAVNNGAHLIAVICKSKMIKHAEKVIKHAKANFELNKSQLSSEDVIKIQRLLNLWEANIAMQRRKLKEEKISLGISTTLMTGFIVMEIIKYVPKELFTFLGSIFSVFTAVVIAVDYGFQFILHALSKRKFNSWNTRFDAWVKERTPSGKIEVKDQPVPIKASEDLFKARMARNRKKIDAIQADYEQFKPQVIEANWQQFQSKNSQLIDTLKQKSTPYHQISDFFSVLDLTPANSRSETLNNALLHFNTQLSKDVLPEEVRHAKKALLDEFELWQKEVFYSWVENQPSEKLISVYIERHETVEHIVKNGLKQIIQNKNRLEKKFLNFNLITSGITFKAALVSAAVSIALLLTGIATFPFWGLSFLLLTVSCAPLALSFAFMVAGVIYAWKHKPQSTKAMLSGMSTSILWYKIRKGIASYQHQNKLKRLSEIIDYVKENPAAKNDPKTQAVLKKSQIEYNKNEIKIQEWQSKLDQKQSIQWQKAWQDFIQYAGLTTDKNNSFDSLQALSEALKECDLRLLDTEIIYLLETQLGIKPDSLYSQLGQNSVFKDGFLKYMHLNGENFINFIQKQENSIKTHMIPNE